MIFIIISLLWLQPIQNIASFKVKMSCKAVACTTASLLD